MTSPPSSPTSASSPQAASPAATPCCGSPGCRCHADPPQPHGPYWQWTAKVNGKTVTRRLTEHQASLYTEWIDNDRKLRAIIAQMRKIAAEATELQLKEAIDR